MMDKVYNAATSLPLQELDDEWVSNVWESEFTEVGLEESSQNGEEILQALQCLREELTLWNSKDNDEVMWENLQKQDVSVKALVAYIGHHIVSGTESSVGADKRILGCMAAQVYTKLLLIPHSSVFKVFHPELYDKSIVYLKQYSTLGSQGGPQSCNLQSSYRALLVDIVTLLETFSLRQSKSSGIHTVDILCSLVRVDSDSFGGNFNNRVPFRLKCTAALAYKGLSFLCSQLHGHLINATCKGLLASLLMLHENKPVQTVNKQIQLIQEHAMNFVCFLLQEYNDKAERSVRTLLQHLCTKVTDRAEYRTKVAASVVKITQHMPDESYCKMVQWFYQVSKAVEMNTRVFAIEVVSTLLSCPERSVTNSIAAELLPYLTHRSQLGIIIDRCSDKAPTVRAKAITCFGQCLVSNDSSIASLVLEVMTPQEPARQGQRPKLIRTPAPQHMEDTVVTEDTTLRPEVTLPQEGSTIATETTSEDPLHKDSPLQRVALTPGFDPNLSDRDGLFSMLRRRASDDKLVVRKAAIQALENAIRFEAPNLTKQNVTVLGDHCRDPGLSVRKQAMQSLTDVLMIMPQNKVVQRNWLLEVIPLVLDRETSISDKCFEILEDLILNNIVTYVRSTSEEHTLAWRLLHTIAQPNNEYQRRCLEKACQHWSRQGKIKSPLILALDTHIGTNNNQAAWMLLAQIAPAAPKTGHPLLINYWKNPDKCVMIMEQALTVTRHFVKHFTSTDRVWLMDLLKGRLLEFSSPPELISGTVKTLAKIHDLENKGLMRKGNQQANWCKELLAASDLYLSKVILQAHSSDYDEELVICHLFTLGEVVQFCPASVSKRIMLLVQSMMATPCIASLPVDQSQPLTQNDKDTSSDDPLLSSQDSQGTQGTQSTQSSQPLTQFRGSIMTQRVRAFAIIALGKLCLQHDSLAKKCTPALGRELEISGDSTIRNNVMIVMCDLCVRYPTTANNYIIKISSVLKDRSPLLRKQTVTQIARLIQEDFLKLKEALFYRFISTLLDECEEIKKFVEFFLIHKLLPSFPNILYQHFIECIFHFNDYTTHSIYNKFSQSEKDREEFSLKGDKHMKKREQLYKFLLESMTDEHRFQIQNKICQEILGGIVDGILPFDNSTKDLLQDSLKILSCKEIKLKMFKSRASEEIATDEKQKAAIVVAVAKKTLMTQVMKKNMIENVVPTVIALKHIMEKERSPLLTDLMIFLREMMKDNKKEVKEILEMDKQLASEIEYDLRKFDEDQARQQSSIAEQANVGSPVIITGGPVAVPGGSRSGSPAQALPVCNLRGMPTGTPRDTPRGTPRGTPYRVAVMNSAKQQVEVGTNQTLGSSRLPGNTVGGPSGSPRVCLYGKPGSQQMSGSLHESSDCIGESNSQVEDVDQTNSGTPEALGRMLRKVNRAISTPAVAMGNITFQGEDNMTFLPPSPILEIRSIKRVFDDLENDKENDENPLGVNSPTLNNQPATEDEGLKSSVPEGDTGISTSQDARPVRKGRKRKTKR